MKNQNHIDTITKFIASQMDGESVPCHNSKALQQLSEAVEAIHKDASGNTLQTLGLAALGAVIARVRSNISAEQALHTFIRGGDRG